MRNGTASPRFCSGFTVAELIITLAIGGIVLSIAIPGVASIGQTFALRAQKDTLLNLIQTARAQAVNTNSYAVICRLENNECADASSPLSLFIDGNDNRRLDDTETTQATVYLQHSQLTWNRTSRLRFAPNGRALNGTLSYCNNGSGFQIVIARTGRVRTVSTSSHCN